MSEQTLQLSESSDAPDDAWTSRIRRRHVPVPTVLQMETTECGAACLAMVLGHFGRWTPLERLRVQCGVSRDGANARSIAVAGRAEGLEVDGFRRRLSQLADTELPAIAYWRFNHFVVIEGVGPKGLRLNDPATGRRTVTWEEVDRDFTGMVLECRPGPEFRKEGKPPSAWSGVISRLGGERPALTYLTVAGLALAVPITLAPMALQGYVDRVVIEGLDEWIPATIATLIVATLLSLWLSWWRGSIARRLGLELSQRQAVEFMGHALRLPVAFYAQRYAGDVAYRVQLVDAVSQVASTQIIPAFIGLVTAVAVGALLFLYSWQLALVAVFAGVAVMLTIRASGRWRQESSARLAREEGTYAGAVAYGLRSMESVKSSGTGGDFFVAATGHHARLINARTRMQIPETLLSSTPAHVSGLASAVVVAGGGFLATWTSLGVTIQQARAALDRLDDLLSQPVDPACADWTVRTPASLTGKGVLTLSDVTFGYSHTAKPLLSGFSVEIRPGRRVALVGASGSGKSTVGRIAVGLLEPWHGSVTLDGEPLAQARAAHRTGMAYVDQDIVLFEGTVRQNITLFDDAMPDEDVVAAARAAAIHDEIAMRPGGYDARVSDAGRNFSGGQCQRLEIARAMARRPRLIILDEATSALDPIVEQAVMESLAVTGAGLLVIAHRLSTVRDCDEIIVIDHGAVLERGTHDELMLAAGAYAALVSS
jgi:ABC-type bacteriocin/lantibiotic exporter with double-glycine peptidase domain